MLIIGLRGIDIVMHFGVLGHSIHKEPEARVRSAHRRRDQLSEDLEEDRPACAMSVVCFIKFSQVNTDTIF